MTANRTAVAGGPLRWRRKLVYSALATSLALLVLGALVELTASLLLFLHARNSTVSAAATDVAAPVTVRHRSVGTLADPYLLFRNQPDQPPGYAQTNSLGLRNGPVTVEPAEGVLRVLFLGGSVAWGYAADSADQSVPALLEGVLNDRPEFLRRAGCTRVEVLNAGVPSYVAWQGALAYARSLRHLRPRLVVTLDGVNEVYAAIRTGQAGWPMRYDPSSDHHRGRRPTLRGALGEWLAYRSSRLKCVQYWQETHPPTLADLAPPPADTIATAYGQALECLADLAAADGAALLAVLQPAVVLEGAKPLTEYEAAVVRQQEEEMPGRNAYYREAYPGMQAELRALVRRRPDAHVLDASRVFAEQSDLMFIDLCHLSPRARALLAEAIGDAIEQQFGDALGRRSASGDGPR